MSHRNWSDIWIFNDPREFWKSLKKIAIFNTHLRDYGSVGPYALIEGMMMDPSADMAYCKDLIETKEKTLSLSFSIDGIFDLKVRNATYARLKSSESSDFFTPIEFVKKDDALILGGCNLEHPLFLPHPDIWRRVEKFVVETDGETIECRSFIIRPAKLKEFYEKFLLESTHALPSVFENERVIITGVGVPSATFPFSETKEYLEKTRE